MYLQNYREIFLKKGSYFVKKNNKVAPFRFSVIFPKNLRNSHFLKEYTKKCKKAFYSFVDTCLRNIVSKLHSNQTESLEEIEIFVNKVRKKYDFAL